MTIEDIKASKVCNSCGIVVLDAGYATFPCPGCHETVICRCKNCRDQSVAYRCGNCNFQGP